MCQSTKRQIIPINSSLKTSGENQNFHVNIPNYDHNNGFKKMSLSSAIISKSYYMINSTDTIDLSETTNSQSFSGITISSGNYTMSQFLTAIGSSLTTASAGGSNSFTYTATHSTNTGKITITSSNASVFTLSVNGSALLKYLGFNSVDAIASNGSGVWVGTNVANLQKYSQLHVHCNLGRNNNNDLIAIINPTPFSYFTDIEYINPDGELVVDVSNNNSNDLQIIITDENNSVVELNGGDVRLSLVFWN